MGQFLALNLQSPITQEPFAPENSTRVQTLMVRIYSGKLLVEVSQITRRLCKL